MAEGQLPTCPGCGRGVPPVACCRRIDPCRSYCRNCTRGIRARQIDGFPVDLLTCTLCGDRVMVHRAQRRPCFECDIHEIPVVHFLAGLLAQRGAEEAAAGFQHVAYARHHLLNTGGRAEYASSVWYRHDDCGAIVPAWQFRRTDPKTGEGAPPLCYYCGGEPWKRSPVRDPAAPALLYLLRFQARGRRFLKIGLTAPGLDRLDGHLRLGAGVVQVVEARFDKVARAEKQVIDLCSHLRTEPHAFMAHFGTRETFRLSAQPLIGDLTTHIGTGAHDHTEEWRQRARQRR